MTDISPLAIVVLAGGISHERDISLRSGRRVADALTVLGHKVTLLDPQAGLLLDLTTRAPDVIFPVVHGATGEDGALLALLETTGIPHVGSRGGPASLAWTKPTAKELVRRAGFATPNWIALSKETFRDLGAASVLEHLLTALPTPLVVKPSQGGSAQGVTIVETAAELPRAMVEAYTYNSVALVEEKVRGTELAVTVIDSGDGPRALPAVEIVPVNGVYSFEARYNAGETLFYAPARITPETASLVSETAVGIHALLGLRHISRIDLIVDDDGLVWFLEANVLPGLTETSLVPQSIEASGATLGDVYESLARAAVATID
ncbi:D-alanine--D-alanine ligase [Cryobacterium algoricola]|uniref:D-alanine--D-alanine ligase n=2 Tax=Cryobacterium TaxID=69578 RepID=A0AA41QWU7_9MICO|nr:MULTISPECIES: D-alanine--D-alanine ligase [Cryobacterium]MCI4659237.1 D-alanine--D-alanine ligase [Cryobacterium zhongshanensis]TFB87617.1 D-alanine--D-alanine ligase [Cryobacterium algoricola]